MITDKPDQVPNGTLGIKTKRGVWDRLLLSIPLLTGLSIVVNPFPHTTAIAEISFYLTVAVLLLLLFYKKTTFTLQTPLTIPFGLFTAWSIFGLLFALDKTNSIHDIYAHLIKYLFFFFVLINFFNSRKKFRYLTWTIIVSSTVFGAWMMIHDYILMGRDISVKLGLQSFSEMPPNIIGVIILFALLLAMCHLKEETSRAGKFILVISLCILSVTTLTAQTRGTLIALFVSLLLSFPRNKRIVTFFSLFLVVATLLLPVRDILGLNALKSKLMLDDRLQIWYVYGEVIKTHPLVGVGFGMQTFYNENLLARYNAMVPPESRPAHLYEAPHNMLVDTAARVGIVGLLLSFYIVFAFIKMGIKTVAKGRDDFIRTWGTYLVAALTALFIQGLLENVLSGPPATVLYTIMGMMTILWHLDRGDPEPAGP